jgi:hypothetical protein
MVFDAYSTKHNNNIRALGRQSKCLTADVFIPIGVVPVHLSCTHWA